MVKALRLKPKGRGFENEWGESNFSIYLILLAALGPGLYSACNRNEYQKQKNNISGEKSAAGAWGWQLYSHLRADYLDNLESLTSHNTIGLNGMLKG
jgi:hypothetical protein